MLPACFLKLSACLTRTKHAAIKLYKIQHLTAIVKLLRHNSKLFKTLNFNMLF